MLGQASGFRLQASSIPVSWNHAWSLDSTYQRSDAEDGLITFPVAMADCFSTCAGARLLHRPEDFSPHSSEHPDHPVGAIVKGHRDLNDNNRQQTLYQRPTHPWFIVTGDTWRLYDLRNVRKSWLLSTKQKDSLNDAATEPNCGLDGYEICVSKSITTAVRPTVPTPGRH